MASALYDVVKWPPEGAVVRCVAGGEGNVMIALSEGVYDKGETVGVSGSRH